MCVFTSQAVVLVLSPILVGIARDLDVSTAVAGQLRIFVAPVVAVMAALLARVGGGMPLRIMLLGSAALVAVGSLASAAAPSFLTLALFAFAAIVAAARTVVGTTYGFTLAGERQLEVGAARAAMQHFGYLAGSVLGGATFALGGRSAVGIAFAALLLAAATPYLTTWTARCNRRNDVLVAS
jgi:predicted MFS family arabinose efflux permease